MGCSCRINSPPKHLRQANIPRPDVGHNGRGTEFATLTNQEKWWWVVAVMGGDGASLSSGLGIMCVVILKVDVDVARSNGALACHVKHLVMVLLAWIIQ